VNLLRRLALGLLALACLPGRGEPSLPPAPTRWATDRAHYLREETRARLDRELEAYERSSHHQVILWISDSLHGVPIEEFAARSMRAWGIGRKQEKDGVVFFVFAKDRKVRIEVGYGLEGQLPDAVANRILQERVVPRLRAGDPDTGIEDGLHMILATLSETAAGETGADAQAQPPPGPSPQEEPRSSADPAGCIVSCVILFFFLAILGAIINQMRRRGRGGIHWSSGSGWSSGGSDSSSSSSDWSSSDSSSDFSGGGGDSGGGGASSDW
jgi:uncharacterized protein